MDQKPQLDSQLDNKIDDHHNHGGGKPNKYIVAFIFVLSAAAMVFSLYRGAEYEVVKGRVLRVLNESENVVDLGSITKTLKEQNLLVEIKGDGAGRQVNAFNDYKPVEAGDIVFLRPSSIEGEWSVNNISRTEPIFIMFAFFVALVLVSGGWKGFYSLVGLMFTFAVIFGVMAPWILSGGNPVLIGVGSAALILTATLYLSYGFNKKSLAAFLGIITALGFVGLISYYFTAILGFTGQGEDSLFLDMATNNPLNMSGLLVAGIIIAAVGVLDDVAVIQSSIVFSLASANPKLRGFRLWKEAMNVGKDHISAVVNTLVLAYTGASLPLILLLYVQDMPLGYFASLEEVAEEIARTLVSSSGILLAVPLTTVIAVLMIGVKRERKAERVANLDDRKII